jgi:hypothetical protein
LVSPVSRRGQANKFKQLVYGPHPWFAGPGPTDGIGVEVIEVAHGDITAIDLSSGLVSARLALETSRVVCYWYKSEKEAFGPSMERNHEPDAPKVTISDTVVTFYTQDPHFAAVLRELVLPGGSATNDNRGSHPFTDSEGERQRLLGMLEAGMPGWAIFCSRYGLFYHRRLRVAIVAAVNLWPLIALIVGLYDLYAHMPHLQEYLLPLFSLYENSWPFRLLLYATYLLTCIAYFISWIASWMCSLLGLLAALAAPLQPLANLLSPLVSAGQTVAFATYGLVRLAVNSSLTLITSIRHLSKVLPLGSSASSFGTGQALSRFWTTAARPAKNLLKGIYDGVVHLSSLLIRHEASLRMWCATKYHRVRSLFYRKYLAWLFLTALIFATVRISVT